MVALAVLDERSQLNILGYIFEPAARLCCRDWAAFLFESLQLQHRIDFAKALHALGDRGTDALMYHHSAVRALGHEFEECVSYQFYFYPKGSYDMQWNRTFDGWTSESEQQVGHWQVAGDKVRCSTEAGPEVDASRVRYARAGLVFEIPVEDVLSYQTSADNAAPLWEYLARGLAPPAVVGRSVQEKPLDQKMPRSVSPDDQPRVPARTESSVAASMTALRPDARFVDIDGDLHEVCLDIQEHWPEEEWERLMRIRVRFGIHGPV
mmetsp:Transcript_51475/g.122417  ORF Transcript_51475/g.122417 Transcript_51475/m.122417 type:complete len:265 (-) Transcript_51475:59-853(-)